MIVKLEAYSTSNRFVLQILIFFLHSFYFYHIETKSSYFSMLPRVGNNKSDILFLFQKQLLFISFHKCSNENDNKC